MPKKTRQQARQQLRDREVAWAAKTREEVMVRQWAARPPPPIHTLTLEQTQQYGFLHRSRQQGHEPRGKSGCPKALIKRLIRMHALHGRLVKLCLSLPHLDRLSLFTDEDRRTIMAAARTVVDAFLNVRGKGVTILEAAIERGREGGTHVHIIVALSGLSDKLQDEVCAAPHGKGGGMILTIGQHAVVIGDTEQNLRRVGRYLSKHPDARATPDRRLGPGDPAHLAFMDELAERQLAGLPPSRVKLSWHTTRRKPTKRRGQGRRRGGP